MKSILLAALLGLGVSSSAQSKVAGVPYTQHSVAITVAFLPQSWLKAAGA